MFEKIIGDIPSTVGDWAHFLVIGVVLRGIFSKWLGIKLVKYFFEPLVRRAIKRLTTTEREIAIWLHHRNRALGHGHNHKSPIVCLDGKCRII